MPETAPSLSLEDAARPLLEFYQRAGEAAMHSWSAAHSEMIEALLSQALTGKWLGVVGGEASRGNSLEVLSPSKRAAAAADTTVVVVEAELTFADKFMRAMSAAAASAASATAMA